MGRMNATLFRRGWDVLGMFDELYWPWLGSGIVRVRDGSGRPLAGAMVTVRRGSVHVTRKLSGADGRVRFGGWAGKAEPTPHSVQVSKGGYGGVETRVQLVGRGETNATVVLTAV